MSSEEATKQWRMDDNLGRIDAGNLCRCYLEHFRRLVGCPEFQRSVLVPARQRRRRLQLRMRQMRRVIGRLDDGLGDGQSLGDIAGGFRLQAIARHGLQPIPVPFRRIVFRHRTLGALRRSRPGDLKTFRRPASPPPAIGNNADRPRQTMYRMHPRHGKNLGLVGDGLRLRSEMAGMLDGGIEHAVHAKIDGILRLPGGLVAHVETRQGFADPAKIRLRSQRRIGRNRQGCGFLRQFAWGGETIDVPRLEVPPSLVGKPLTLRAGENGQYDLFDDDGHMLLRGKVGEAATGNGISLFVRDFRAQPGTEFRLRLYSLQSVLKSLEDKIEVAEQGKQSGVIGITVKDRSPQLAADEVNAIEEAYVVQNIDRHSAEAQQSLEFLQKQIPQLKKSVEAAQQQLNDYQSRHGSVDVTKETELVLQRSVDLEETRLQLAQQREEALQRFTRDHPVVRSIDEKLVNIAQEQDKIKDQTGRLPSTQQEILSLTRDLDVANQLYTAMLNSVQQLEVAKAGTVGNVRVVDRSFLSRPTAPRSSARFWYRWSWAPFSG